MRNDPDVLTRLWREQAAILRSRAAEVQATILEQCADELEAAQRAHAQSRVGLDEAVEITGFTRGHIRRLAKKGKLRNVGTEEMPEFLRGDLPRKPGYVVENETLAPGSEAAANYAWQAARAALFKR